MSLLKLTDIVKKLETIPTIPEHLAALQRVVDDPKAGAEEVADVVMKDHIISGKLLKIVNSAFYAPSKPISNIEESVYLIGKSAIKNLMLATMVSNTFKGSQVVSGLWVHTLCVGIFSKAIAKRKCYSNPDELFICGLLHDIGKAVEYYLHSLEVKKVIEACAQNTTSFAFEERNFFEEGHDRIGQILLEKWKLPRKITRVVGNHHRPLNAG